MRKFLLAGVAAILHLGLFAQSPVPTSWDCSTGVPPEGWTFNNSSGGNTNYSAAASCDGVSSLRLDATGEYLEIFFGQQPGAITYRIGGSTTGSPWEGTFAFQESVNGSNWTDIVVYNDGELPVGSTPCLTETFTVTNPLSRYVRWFFVNKISGSNLKVDEISVEEPQITSATIALFTAGGASPVLANTVAPLFNTSSVTYQIRNAGTEEALEISQVEITGSNASAFSVAAPILPASIDPEGLADLDINFTPDNGPGSYTAMVTITSNDAVTPSYSFTVYAVSGTLATEPNSGISELTEVVNKSYRLVVGVQGNNVLNSDPVGGYILLRSVGAPVSDAPADGTVYKRGMSIGNAKVVYVGRPGSDQFNVNSKSVIAGTNYHFAAFPYYGNGTFTNYLNTISNVQISTPATMVSSSEYNGINTNNASFVSDLTALINPHQFVFYSNYTNTMVNLFLSRDTFVVAGANEFSRVINCVYSGETRAFNDPFDWSALGYSREHTYPHSWMPSFPADNPEQPEFNDQHNLYPARQSNVNDLRCNYPLGEVETIETQFLEGKLGLDINGDRVYEPQDSHKGRAARSLMYMATCYSETNNQFSFTRPIGNTCGGTPISNGQDQNVIKKWHFMYPPDNFDIARNDFLDSLQQNRNPFVDNVDYACFIDFNTITKIDNPPTPCYTTGIKDVQDLNLLIYPNPGNGNFRISFKGTGEAIEMNITDLSGKLVFNNRFQASTEVQVFDFTQNDLAPGMYIVSLKGKSSSANRPLIVTE